MPLTKTVTFNRVVFTREVFEDAIKMVESVGSAWVGAHPSDIDPEFLPDEGLSFGGMRVERGNTAWYFEDLQEFLADIGTEHQYSNIRVTYSPSDVSFAMSRFTAHQTSVSVDAYTRGDVERIMSVFEKAAPKLQRPLPLEPEPVAPKPIVFIGHGGSRAWRDVKDHLADLHGYTIESYESGSRSGHTIRDVLASMLDNSTFAILVMTAEDQQSDDAMRARQNVVHEAGLFQGRLGFTRVAILLEEGVQEFSNLAGIQYIPFAPGNIRETFGDVLAHLRREFHTER
jgi:predicted nucleotide-binding protein